MNITSGDVMKKFLNSPAGIISPHRNLSGDEKFITRINLDELKGFVETVEGLPCSIEEATQLGVNHTVLS